MSGRNKCISYHTISDINNTINLYQYIDNRDGNKQIGLKFISYNIGWYNIINSFFKVDGNKIYNIESGFYSFQQIADEFKKENIILTVNDVNGIAELTSPLDLKIKKDLRNMLGFSTKRLFEKDILHEGNKFVDLAIYKSLYIHSDQINTSSNFLDGMPSTLLTVIPVENKEFGENITIRFEQPEYKYLVNGEITELKLEIRDEENKKIINRLPITCILEII